MTASTLVSIVIPCRDERPYMEACLASILASDYPRERLEVLVVDGMSDDGTRDIVAAVAARDPRVRLLDNPRGITPAALNIGIAAARGDVVMRMDAHCHYPRAYVSTLVAALAREGADNVGGVCRTLPGADTAMARAIAGAMSTRFGVGNSQFRVGVDRPTWTDTVPFGCYRRDVFARIGGFDEELVRNQDDEFNHRLLKAGGRILLVPDVVVDYFARPSLAKVARMFWQYGYFKPLVAAKLGRIFTLRQLVPPLFAATLLVLALLAPFFALARWGFVAVLLLHAGAAVAASLAGSRDLAVAVRMPLVFWAMHLGYGFGFLVGLVRVVTRTHAGSADAGRVAVTR